WAGISGNLPPYADPRWPTLLTACQPAPAAFGRCRRGKWPAPAQRGRHANDGPVQTRTGPKDGVRVWDEDATLLRRHGLRSSAPHLSDITVGGALGDACDSARTCATSTSGWDGDRMRCLATTRAAPAADAAAARSGSHAAGSRAGARSPAHPAAGPGARRWWDRDAGPRGRCPR